MQGVLRTRRGLAAASAAVIGCILLLLFATASHWRPLLNKNAAVGSAPPSQSTAALPASPSPEPTAPASPKDAALAPNTVEGPPLAVPPQTPSTTTTAALEPGSSTPTKSKPNEKAASPAVVPSFDIVRIEPTGDSVIAARAAPNSEITLLDGNMPIAHATADANGQVALLPPPLKPGEHSLILSVMTPGSGKALSSQAVVVSVPQQPKTAPMVAMIQPNAPATILSGPVAGTAATPGLPPSGAGAGEPGDAVAIRSVEVESMGSFLAAGKAAPGSQSRVYLNGSYVATVTADKFGKWELQIKRGMKPGRYAVRVDQVEPKTGKVTARAEVPFDYPRTVSSSLRKRLAGSPEPSSNRTGAQGATASSEPGRAAPSKTAAAGKPGSEATLPSTGLRIASAAPSSAPAGSDIAARTGGSGSRSAPALSDSLTGTGAATARPATVVAGSAGQPDVPKRSGETVPAGSTAPAAVTVQSPVAGSSGTIAQGNEAKSAGAPDLPASAARSGHSTATQPGRVSPGTVAGPEVAKSAPASASSQEASATRAAVPAPSASADGNGVAAALPGSGATGSGDTATRMAAAAPGASSSTGRVAPQSDVAAIVPGQAPSTDDKRGGSGASGDGTQVDAGQGHATGAGSAGVVSSSDLLSPGAGQPPSTAGQRTASAGMGDETRVDAGQGAAAASEPGEVATGDPMGSAVPDEVEPTIVPELVTATVFRGDSLWRISRKMLGHGIRYTQIYAANTKQIRDPNLIYPGQVFVVPQAGPL